MKFLLLALTSAFLLAQQTDDPHKGQPDSCNNYYDNTHKCECQRANKCKQDQEAAEDSKCQTYCRKTACKCLDPCTSHNHHKRTKEVAAE